jgi:hypothetical protein
MVSCPGSTSWWEYMAEKLLTSWHLGTKTREEKEALGSHYPFEGFTPNDLTSSQ